MHRVVGLLNECVYLVSTTLRTEKYELRTETIPGAFA